MKIRDKAEDKAQELTDYMTVQAQAKYLQWVMKEYSCTYEEAWDICTGELQPNDPEDPKAKSKITLGFKLANPVLQIALFKQIPKKNRKLAADNFAEGLNDEEREIFYSEVFNEESGKRFKAEYKKEKKKRGVNVEAD